MKIKYNIKSLFVFVFLISTLSVTAANPQIIFPDNVDDETPAAPIDGFIGLGIVTGIYFGVRKKKLHKE